MSVQILIGDCMERMRELPDASVDSCVCDPPYHLTSIVKRFGAANAAPAKVGRTGAYERASRGFMGQQWDGGDVAFRRETWEEVFRVLKPGAHLVAFSGTRTYHRMACSIEDAGFEIRDQLAWCYGSGFPKSHDVSKQIDKAAGAVRKVIGSYKATGSARTLTGGNYGGGGNNVEERDRIYQTRASTPEAAEWEGWGTALKPAWEPIALARKPLVGTVAANVLQHGTGALNIDGCRIDTDDDTARVNNVAYGLLHEGRDKRGGAPFEGGGHDLGRWPANIIHDGSEEVLAAFPETAPSPSTVTRGPSTSGHGSSNRSGEIQVWPCHGDSGSAARFFYCAKTSSDERGEGNNHPTVKPVDLMRWLCRLVTPKGGTVLDPFAGSGSTLIAADAEQFHAIGCELSPEYAAIAERRVRASAGLFAEVRAA